MYSVLIGNCLVVSYVVLNMIYVSSNGVLSSICVYVLRLLMWLIYVENVCENCLFDVSVVVLMLVFGYCCISVGFCVSCV